MYIYWTVSYEHGYWEIAGAHGEAEYPARTQRGITQIYLQTFVLILKTRTEVRCRYNFCFMARLMKPIFMIRVDVDEEFQMNSHCRMQRLMDTIL